MIISVKLTVLFNAPFWIGIFEIEEGEHYKVSKVTFGAEPKDAEVYEFILRDFYKMNFKKWEVNEEKYSVKRRINPKRIQREIKKETESKGIGTKAQIVIKQQHEENKIERKKRSREEKEKEQRRMFEIKKSKRKEKHKGH